MKRADNGALTKTMAPSCPTLGAGGEPPKGDVKDNSVTRYWDGDVNDSNNEKHRHRQNVTSHHSFSLLRQF